MPPIEVGSTRAIGAVSADLIRKTSADASTASAAKAGAASTAGASVAAKPTVATSAALNPGEAPVDTDRVSQIRKAVESGSYPLLPAKIADAMIAAGIFLRSANA